MPHEMTTPDEHQKKVVTLQPGDYRVSQGQEVLTTLLGSCVSTCLYDPINKVAGMNHFLLAYCGRTDSVPLQASDAGRYGIHAMELLIHAMVKHGASPHALKAKVFGGASVLSNYLLANGMATTIGASNISFVNDYLKSKGIATIASDLGLTIGRVVYFNTDDYSVRVRSIHHQQPKNVATDARVVCRTQLSS